MAPDDFSVTVTARFERDYRRLLRGAPVLARHYSSALAVLKSDPFNRSRTHAIKKLEGVPPGEGQYRIRSGRFRLRYDVAGKVVFLKYCSLRREDTY